jgi:hypothetical protein
MLDLRRQPLHRSYSVEAGTKRSEGPSSAGTNGASSKTTTGGFLIHPVATALDAAIGP